MIDIAIKSIAYLSICALPVLLSTSGLAQDFGKYEVEERCEIYMDSAVSVYMNSAPNFMETTFQYCDSLIDCTTNKKFAYVFKGIMYNYAGLNFKAYQAYSSSLKLEENNYAFIKRGQLFMKLGEEQKALDDFAKAVELAEDFDEEIYATNQFYILYSNKRHYSTAHNYLWQLHQKNPSYEGEYAYMLHMNLALSFGHLAKSDSAVVFYRSAMRLRPNEQGIYTNLALEYTDIGQYDSAKLYFEKSFGLVDNDLNMLNAEQDIMRDAFLYNNYAYLLIMTSSFDSAQAYIDTSLMIFANNSYAYRNQALLYIYSGQDDKICSALQRAQQLGFTEKYGSEVDGLARQYCE